MASELRRGAVRLITNYTRLGLTFALGLGLVIVLLRGVGVQAYGLIALLGSSVGIAALFQEVVSLALNRELGAAHHTRDRRVFVECYNSAIVACLGVALLSATLFALLAVYIRIFEIPDPLIGAARLFVLAKGAQIFCTVLMAPAFNMYVVTERFALVNLWMVLDRAAYVVVAVVVLLLPLNIQSHADIAKAVIIYGFGSMGLVLLVFFTAVAVIVRRDRRLVPALSSASRNGVKSIVTTGGWNVVASIAMNMHFNLGAIIMNLAFGLLGNTIFALAKQVPSYARMLTAGMTFGIDAVSARISSDDDPGKMARFVHHATRMHALVAFPGAVAVFFLAEPILSVWVGRHVPDPAAVIPPAAMLVRILMVGAAIRAVSNGWVRMLYGAGHVRACAPWILVGGLLNPVIAVALLYTLPGEWRITAVGWAFTGSMLLINAGVLPFVTARKFGVGVGDVLLPLIRPTAASLLALPAILAVGAMHRQWTLLWLLAALALYAGVYTLLAIVFVLSRQERDRFRRAFERRVFGGGQSVRELSGGAGADTGSSISKTTGL